MSLHCSHISVALSHLSVCMCCHNLSSGMCIPYWLHRGSGIGTFYRISIMDFQCMYMKLSLSLTGLYALSGNPSTSHAADFNTHEKDTTYVSGPPPPTSTPWVCVMTLPWDLSMWWRSDDADIVAPHYLQFTLVLFLYINVSPYYVALRLYISSTFFPHMKPEVKKIEFIFPRFVCRPTTPIHGWKLRSPCPPCYVCMAAPGRS